MKIKLLLAFCLLSIGVFAQDVIIKRNGDEIQAKVLTVSASQVDYKKWSNQEGPTYILPRADIFMIKYANGDKDVFGDDSPSEKEEVASPEAETGSPRYVRKAPAPNNAELVKRYSPDIRIATKPSDKDAKGAFPVLAVSDFSVLATEDIEVSIVPQILSWHAYDCMLRYYIRIENKTDATIYIDRGNTFKVYKDGSSEAYYNPNQVNVTKGGSMGVGVNLGGVANVLGIGGAVGTLAGATTVGGASQNAVTTSYAQERILAIPPHATANLTEYKEAHVKGKQYKTISEAEYWYYPWGFPNVKRGMIKKGGYVHYDEDSSPDMNKYYLTYSSHADFSTYSTITFGVYIRYLIGGFLNFSTLRKEQYIKYMQKYLPDFWDNPYIIVGSDFFVGR